MRQLIPALALGLAAAVSSTAHAIELTDFELRLSYFDQTGFGYQSPAGPPQGPGSEAATIFQPSIRGRLRDGNWSHDATISVDIVTNASTDALDAISSASKMNESVTADVTSAYSDAAGKASLRYGGHLEEPLRSAFLGGGYTKNLADDNATVGISGLVLFDSVDEIPYNGGDSYMATGRWTFNLNAAGSQILSPTTVVDGGYGLTVQSGQLATSYNSVPLDNGGRGPENFDGTRVRHAFRGHLAQFVPATHSAIQASYRFYVDNYGLVAHTADVALFQYLVDWLYLRGTYRLHHQSGVDFYGTLFSVVTAEMPRTSDSDLAPFTAHEVGLKVRLLGERSPLEIDHAILDLSFFRYWRSNDLVVNWLGLAVGWRY